MSKVIEVQPAVDGVRFAKEIVGTIVVNGKGFGVRREVVDCVICSAFEGGIDYWASRTVVAPEAFDLARAAGKGTVDYGHEVVSRGGTVTIVDGDDDSYVLTLENFLNGLEVEYNYYGKRYGDLEEWYECHDAGDADKVIQRAIFEGGVVYG